MDRAPPVTPSPTRTHGARRVLAGLGYARRAQPGQVTGAPADCVVVIVRRAVPARTPPRKQRRAGRPRRPRWTQGRRVVVAGDRSAGDGNVLVGGPGRPDAGQPTVSTVDNVGHRGRADQRPCWRCGRAARRARRASTASGQDTQPVPPARPRHELARWPDRGSLGRRGALSPRRRGAGRGVALTARAPARPGSGRTTRGRTVTLLGGPALAARPPSAAAVRSARRPVSARPRRSSPGSVSGAVGVYDDLAGARPEQARTRVCRAPRRAARGPGHQRARSRSPASGAAGLVAAALLTRQAGERAGGARRRACSAPGVIAGTANLVNLLDLRPGRAVKAGAARRRAAGARPRRRAGRRPLGAAVGAAARRPRRGVMLGDCGANALGALLGLRWPRAPARRPGRRCSPARGADRWPARRSASPRSSQATRRGCASSTGSAAGPVVSARDGRAGGSPGAAPLIAVLTVLARLAGFGRTLSSPTPSAPTRPGDIYTRRQHHPEHRLRARRRRGAGQPGRAAAGRAASRPATGEQVRRDRRRRC